MVCVELADEKGPGQMRGETGTLRYVSSGPKTRKWMAAKLSTSPMAYLSCFLFRLSVPSMGQPPMTPTHMSLVICMQYRLEYKRGQRGNGVLKPSLFSCSCTFFFQGLLHVEVHPHMSRCHPYISK